MSVTSLRNPCPMPFRAGRHAPRAPRPVSEGRRAFTLVELLVVIGIIAVLISILLPAMRKAKGQAIRTECASNLHQWGIALTAYSAQHKGYFPNNTTGRHMSWISPGVQDFLREFLTPLSGMGTVEASNQTGSSGSGKSNVTFCPTQDWHRYVRETSGSPNGEELIGYFYFPHRDLNYTFNTGVANYTPAGNGWVTKKKFAGPDRHAPVMSDMVQTASGAEGGSGQPFSNHFDPKLARNAQNPWPRIHGGNYLFEDGHVVWVARDGIEIGGTIGTWETWYKIRIPQ